MNDMAPVQGLKQTNLDKHQCCKCLTEYIGFDDNKKTKGINLYEGVTQQPKNKTQK